MKNGSRVSERDAKLDELGLHYGMDELELNGGAEYYKKLALALATDFVPGFYDVPRRGRCSKWPMLAGWLRVCEMDRYIDGETSHRAMSDAATQCALKAHWRQYLERTRITRESDRPPHRGKYTKPSETHERK